MSDLVKRLRESRATWQNARSAPTDLETEAAARIEALEAQRDELLEILDRPDQSCGKTGRYHYDWYRVDAAIEKAKETQ